MARSNYCIRVVPQDERAGILLQDQNVRLKLSLQATRICRLLATSEDV